MTAATQVAAATVQAQAVMDLTSYRPPNVPEESPPGIKAFGGEN